MKNNFKKVAFWLIPALFVPMVVGAQQINNLLQQVRTTLGIVIGILFVLMTLYFIWGVIQYVTAGGDEEKLKQGKRHMLWGIIGMAVAGAVWGIVAILWNYLGVTPGGNIPTINV